MPARRFAFALSLLLTAAPASADVVDLELVLAVDVSMSMDGEEQGVQREGYADAIVDGEVLRAIGQGIHGRIAVAYVEWAGVGSARMTVPWHVISDASSAEVFAGALRAAPLTRARRTSISSGMTFSADLFDDNGFEGLRRVIDVSGDGPNNQGQIVNEARDEILARGVTINGLPLMFRAGGWLDIDYLDEYYRDCVIGGPGSFVLPVREKANFAKAIRDKLVLEIADRATDEPPVVLASSTPKVSCTIGEYLWQRRMEN